MKEFFKKYKVLFAAVWNKEIFEDVIVAYFSGNIDFQELIQEFDFYDEYEKEMKDIKNVAELEDFVRDNNIFNMWD